MAFHENHSRSIVKTITYRLLIIVSNGIFLYMITDDADLTADFIGLTTIASTLLYFIHERMWNGIHWGKKHIHYIHHHRGYKRK